MLPVYLLRTQLQLLRTPSRSAKHPERSKWSVTILGDDMSYSRRSFLTHASAATAMAMSTNSLISETGPANPRQPNVVLIMTDNQGAWTLGCYGNPDIRTPNIDKLAAEGARFARALNCNPVCSPARASYLTGLIPSQHGIHNWFDDSVLAGPTAYDGLAEFETLPKLLKKAGYTCGVSGKWHLGDCLHPPKEFDLWTTTPHGALTTFYGAEVVDAGKVRVEPGYLIEYWTQRGIQFIEENKDRPFFLYLPLSGPYSLGPIMSRAARNRHASQYAQEDLLSFPRDSMHPWQHDNKSFHNTMTAIRRMAAECSGVDDCVGDVIAALKRLNLDDNTLVIYCADHGWMGGQLGIWGMGDHTRPLGAFELMMQVPLIFRQPGTVVPGAVHDMFVSNYDFLPSLLSFIGLSHLIPASSHSPGRDYSPFLRGSSVKWDNSVFYEMEFTRAIRSERWKYVDRYPDGPNELYDMEVDPHEHMNLFGQPKLASIQRNMSRRLDEFFHSYADPRYNLWRGGVSKQGADIFPDQNRPDGEPS